jgi:hypothetical protein
MVSLSAHLFPISARSFDRIDDLFYTYLSRFSHSVEKRASDGLEEIDTAHQVTKGLAIRGLTFSRGSLQRASKLNLVLGN